jgi:hypothetical protein
MARWRQGQVGRVAGDLLLGHGRRSIFLLTLYGKGEKEDLSAADLKRIVKLLAELTDG